jgi:hypothetical protein
MEESFSILSVNLIKCESNAYKERTLSILIMGEYICTNCLYDDFHPDCDEEILCMKCDKRICLECLPDNQVKILRKILNKYEGEDEDEDEDEDEEKKSYYYTRCCGNDCVVWVTNCKYCIECCGSLPYEILGVTLCRKKIEILCDKCILIEESVVLQNEIKMLQATIEEYKKDL